MSKLTFSAAGGAVPAEGLKTRRAALSILARASTLAVASSAALLAGQVAPLVADPVFAAIERHKADWARYGAHCATTDEVAAEQGGRTITQADCDAFEAVSAAEQESCDALVATAPTTMAGLRAAIEYFVELDRGSVPRRSGDFLATLLKSPLIAA